MKESSSDLNIIFGLQFQKIFLRFQGCPTIDQTFHVNAASLRITRLGSSNDFFNFNKILFMISDAHLVKNDLHCLKVDGKSIHKMSAICKWASETIPISHSHKNMINLFESCDQSNSFKCSNTGSEC